MSLTQSLIEIKEELKKNGTIEQKKKFASFGFYKIDEMARIAQSMGAKSSIKMFL